MMKQMRIDGDVPFLPQEVITNILLRLPVKSLIRFQCVCKLWKHVIKTPSFIADHFHHSSNHNPLLLLRWKTRFDPLHLHLLDWERRLLEVHPSPLINSLSTASIVGTSNGLLCVKIDGDCFLLWNPAIRQVRQVLIDGLDDYSYAVFGFSPIVNDYKIVIYFEHEFDFEHNRMEVYSLSTGSRKEIKVGKLGAVFLNSQIATASGAIFWYDDKQVVEDDDYERMIVSFDLAMEVFTSIPIPAFDPNTRARLITSRVAVFGNKLAMISSTVIGNCESCLIDLWVMEEGIGASGERRTWTKKYSISSSLVHVNPFGIWGDEIVCHIPHTPWGVLSETECEANNGGINVLSLLNLTTHESKYFATPRCGYSSSVIFNYAKSLVPVPNIHIEES